MEEDRRNKDDKNMEENKKYLRNIIASMKNTKNTNPNRERGYKEMLQLILRDMPNPPRLRGNNYDEMISLVEDYLEGKQSTNLIDRAKDMNEKHPRMGSGRNDS